MRYAIASDTLPVPPRWRKIAAMPGAMLLENERVIDRIFVAARVIVGGASHEEIIDRMSMVHDLRDVAWNTALNTDDRMNGPAPSPSP